MAGNGAGTQRDPFAPGLPMAIGNVQPGGGMGDAFYLYDRDGRLASEMGAVNRVYTYTSFDQLETASNPGSLTPQMGDAWEWHQSPTHEIGAYERIGGPGHGWDNRTYGTTHELLSRSHAVAPTMYGYDDQGNMERRGDHIYEYDAFNRLRSVFDTTTGTTGVYDYDAFDRRVRKDVQGPGVPNGVTEYVYEDDDVIQEVSDGPLREFVHGQAVDHVIQMTLDVDGDGSTTGSLDGAYYYHHDERGSVRFLTDKAGAVVEEYMYEPYGAMVILTPIGSGLPYSGSTAVSWYTDEGTPPQSAVGNPYMFTGRRWDPESGLYYYRARMYEPHDAVFLQPDPIGTWGDVGSRGNAYAYVGNNPVMNTDPNGMWVQFLIGAVAGCAVGAGAAWISGGGAKDAGSACAVGAVAGLAIATGNPYLIGCGVSMVLQGAGDLTEDHGRMNGGFEYVGACVAGVATVGCAKALRPPTVVEGAVIGSGCGAGGAAAGSLITQGLRKKFGDTPCSIDKDAIKASARRGALAGLFGGPIAGGSGGVFQTTLQGISEGYGARLADYLYPEPSSHRSCAY